jgi:hypothetical protein
VKQAQWPVPGMFHNLMAFMICTNGLVDLQNGWVCGFWAII